MTVQKVGGEQPNLVLTERRAFETREEEHIPRHREAMCEECTKGLG